jgi:hypothetical protein
MKKLLAAVALFAAVGLVAARPADAHVGVAIGIGLPGFAFFAGAPPPAVVYPPPVVYPAPVYYGPVYAPAYVAPGVGVYGVYGVYGRPWHHWRHGAYRVRWHH